MFDYKIGDVAWFVPYGEKRSFQGEITDINLDVSPPYVTLMLLIDSKFRTTTPELLAETSKDAKKIFQEKPNAYKK